MFDGDMNAQLTPSTAWDDDAAPDADYLAAFAAAPAPAPQELELMVMSARDLLEYASGLPVGQRHAILSRLDPDTLDEWEVEELARQLATVLGSVTALQLRTRNAL